MSYDTKKILLQDFTLINLVSIPVLQFPFLFKQFLSCENMVRVSYTLNHCSSLILLAGPL